MKSPRARSRDEALIQTMLTAGRTVVFSATTVALSMAAMVLFPMYFLKSFAYAGIATVAFCALAALVVTPAAIVLLGPRLDAFDVRRVIRRLLRPRRTAAKPGAAVVLVPLDEVGDAAGGADRPGGLGGAAGARRCRSWESSGASPTIGCCRGPRRRIRSVTGCATGFADDSETAVTVVVPDADGLTPADFERYAAAAVAGGRRLGGQCAHRCLRRRPEGRPAGRCRRGQRRQRLPDGRQQCAAVLRRLRGAAGSAARRSRRPAVAPSSSPAWPRSTATASTPSPRGCRWCSASSRSSPSRCCSCSPAAWCCR